MKLRPVVLAPALLALVACAPQARIVREIPADSGPSDESESALVLPVETGPTLLEPPTLLGMPSERDMQPTTDPEPASPPVIANPSRED